MKKLYEEEDIREIACAIRAKCGSDQSYKVCDMAKAIEEISSGGDALIPRLGFEIEELDEVGYIKSGSWHTWGHIGDYAFYGERGDHISADVAAYSRLVNVRFSSRYGKGSEGITYIGKGAFQGCEQLALTSLPVPEHTYIVTIGDNAFKGCKNLALTSLPPTMKEIGTGVFQSCSKITATSLPQGITKIGDYAFMHCRGLAITSIPAGVTEIGYLAFYNCTGLTSITFKGTPSSIYLNAFSGCTNLKTINVPWAEGAVSGAPWGATNATINYNYTE